MRCSREKSNLFVFLNMFLPEDVLILAFRNEKVYSDNWSNGRAVVSVRFPLLIKEFNVGN